MSPRAARVALALSLSIAVLWPFACGPKHLGSDFLRVHPSLVQEIVTGERGKVIGIQYKIENLTGFEVELSAPHKSCKCIEVDLSPSSLKPLEVATVVLRTEVPYAGDVEGAIILQAAQANGDARFRTGLQFRVVPDFTEGVEVAPTSLTRTHYPGATLSISAVGTGTPIALQVHDSSGATVPGRQVDRWQSIDQTRFATVYIIDRHNALNSGAIDSIAVSVEFDSGQVLKGEVSVK